jgi:hypothetical protein
MKIIQPALLAVCALMTTSIPAAEESRYEEPYPEAASKKGLQVEIVDDALELGIKHAALNFDLAQAIRGRFGPEWSFQGLKYRFNEPYLRTIDQKIKTLSDRGVVVNLIVLAYKSTDQDVNRILLHPKCIQTPPNRLGNFNTLTFEGSGWFQATMQFCAERWSRPDRKYGRVSGYIIGNEVNSHWWWANMGHVTMQEFANDYLRTVRLAHSAIRSQASWLRVYVSLEHHWNIRYGHTEGIADDERKSFPAREFIDYFAEHARIGGDFDWGIAFHPYPENLFEPRFWNDKSATNDVLTTPRITFKNIELLPNYLLHRELLFDSQPRHIILSEQGFHTPIGSGGETIQAAAYAYAYKKIEGIDGIDAFILHRHVDSPHEGGLLLGLRRSAPERAKKRSWEVFRAADTPEWESAFEFALPIIGVKSWSEISSQVAGDKQ